MGYFTNGIVFCSPPNFEAASQVVPGRLARGYKHRRASVWLLDLWKPKGNQKLRRGPFCDPLCDGYRSDLVGANEVTRAFLKAFEGLQRALDNMEQEPAYVHLGIAISKAAACPAFVFAADDEVTDLGCSAEVDGLISLGCRLDRLSVQYCGGKTIVTPLNYLEDGDEDGLLELIRTVEKVPGISVSAPRDIEGGQSLYENPVGEWPPAAGDPGEILGLGTWDPLLNLDQDFEIVFEKLD